ncbi:iron-sulfur cluster-binding domain-containing protein [Rhodococcus qingshengii]|uniref:flavin reductase family protein n=1 Tax=Rhodococcus erythropolis TaxID=1833 RepID=UPI001E504E19|nr:MULTISPECIES: iron-sulfur cluster-binding domain-containing protein [Rhodococcus erythropolis group]MCD2105337.1 iron-sulfur cluster-binding domain-containing protein [Rhodococcus qingshengii]
MYALGVGESVRVRDPRNGFMFVEDGPVLFVAGGIGITPIVAMVRRARELGMDWQLVYSGRSRASMPFLDEIESWDCTRVAVLVDDGNGPPTPPELLRRAPIGGAVYCCGPESMLEAVQKNFGATSARALRVERFGMAPITDGEAFEVVLGQTGEVLQVPADRSVLDVLLERRPEIQYSCRQGFCGTCVTQVLSATPPRSAEGKDHNVDRMLTCTGRAAEGSRIVLDL